MNDALNFREFLGGEKKIHQYMHELAVKAGQLMAKIFTQMFYSKMIVLGMQRWSMSDCLHRMKLG